MSRKQAAAPRKVGIIIANTGTPEAPTRKAVKKYLSQFLMDPRICPMPRPVWWTLLHTTILRKRSRASAEKYQKIWTEEGSPLVAITASLERGLNDYYAEQGLPVVVRAGMSYGKPSLKRAVKELKEEGVWVFGTAADGTTDLYGADLKGPAAIVIGSEGSGMTRLAAENCDFLVSIPMKGRISSLNASAAAAILLYEAVRQRG